MNMNLAPVNLEVRFRGCFNAKIGLVSINFLLVSGLLIELSKFMIV